jgi:hypothetical protein
VCVRAVPCRRSSCVSVVVCLIVLLLLLALSSRGGSGVRMAQRRAYVGTRGMCIGAARISHETTRAAATVSAGGVDEGEAPDARKIVQVPDVRAR